MKINHFAFIVSAAAGLFFNANLQADDLFKLSWRGTAYSADSTGRMVARSFSEKDFVQKVAVDNGLDPRTLVFVYRADKHDTAVMRIADGSFVSDVIQMEYNYTDVSNSTQTQIARQAFLNDEYHSGALGSAFGTARASYDKNGNLSSFSFRGTFNYTIDGTIYTGTFSTGTRVKDLTGA